MGWVKELLDGSGRRVGWRAFESKWVDGRRFQANASGRLQLDAVREAKAKLERKIRDATLEPNTLTLGGYLDRWIDHRATKSRSAKSHSRYKGICDAIPAELREKRLTAVRTLELQRYLDELDAAEERATTLKRYTVLHAAFEQAVAWKLLHESPMEGVSPPQKEDREMTALSEKLTAELIGGLDGRYAAPALVDVTTGLRRGELLALAWRHVDLDGAEMRVWRTVDEEPGKPPVVRDYLKTRWSRRRIALMDATVQALRAHKERQAEERAAAKIWHDHGLVFAGRNGDVWRPSTFSVGWGRLPIVRAIATEVGAPLRFHDLRHTHATQLLRAGVPVDAVAKRLGHRDAVITMRIYAHVLDDADAIAVERLEASLGTVLAGGSGTDLGTSNTAESEK